MVEEEKRVFVLQIDICLCLFVRHPPQRLVISQPDKVPLLDGAIAGRQAGGPLRQDPWAYILAVEMGDTIKLGGDHCC